MFEKINDIKRVNGVKLLDKRLYTFIDSKKRLYEYDIEGNVLWFSDELDIYYRYHVRGSYILYTLKKKELGTYILSRNTKQVIRHEENYLNINNYACYDEDVLYSFTSGNIEAYDLSLLKFRLVLKDNTQGIVQLIVGAMVVTNDNTHVCTYNKADFIPVWQKDLSSELTYHRNGKEVQGQIKQVKEYEDSIIVVSDGGVIRLSLETGEIMWKAKGYTRTMELVGNIGYCCSGLGLWRLNMISGEISGYGWEYQRLPDIKWNEKIYWSSGHEVVYHEGLLWYSVYASSESFLVAINPHDGHYEWVHHVETNEKIDSPKFHDDKMFLLDTGSTLHIYEKNSIMK